LATAVTAFGHIVNSQLTAPVAKAAHTYICDTLAHIGRCSNIQSRISKIAHQWHHGSSIMYESSCWTEQEQAIMQQAPHY
jgi:hypothetical protein